MTVVLAVRCAEGVVLASDGQSTDLSGGNIAFATRAIVQKLFPLGTHIAWGATGNVGLIQRFDHQLQQLDPATLGEPIETLRGTLAGIQRHLQRQATNEVIQGIQGQQVPTIGVLFAGYTGGRPWILEVTAGGEDTVYDDFYAIGSGGVFGKLALASVAHFDIPGRSLSEAEVIAWRALDGCINVSAFGLGHPIWIYRVTADGSRSLDENELLSVSDSVNAWKQEELDALGRLGLGAVARPPAEDEGLAPDADEPPGDEPAPAG